MILETRNLSVEYRIGVRWLNALYDIALQIRPHEIHGLVGESGSGKSTLALTVMRYLQPNARIANGSILFNDVDIAQRSQTDMGAIWGKQIALVPQNPLEALNPTLTIGAQMTEVTRLHLGLSAADARQQAIEDLQKVKIADAQTILGRYPHQLSGGMQQRVMIATALSTHPQLLILDEPTTALDVTTQAVILDLLRMRVRESGASALYVSHNLGTIAQLCDGVTVLYGGEVMESAPVRTIFHQALHPYTRGLLESIPSPSQVNEARLTTIGGVAPSLAERATGCAFATRCPIAIAKCHSEKPPTEAVSESHSVRCWRWHEIADGSVAPHNRVAPPEHQAPARADVVLTVQHLNKTFREDSLWRRLMGKPAETVQAVDDVNLHVNGRSTLGVVGESGSGKTTLARAIVALTPADSGTIELLERPISLELRQRDAATLQNLRLIFQNPNDALNPRRTVGQTIGRTLQRLTDRKRSAKEIEKEVGELLVSIGLAPEYARRYPGQLSGGEKQRVAIARAFATSPALIIADEPTSALDVSVQAVIVNLLKDLRTRAGLSYVVISHDLELIGYLAEWIAVMYLGEIVEQGTTADVYGFPSHPYTEALVSAIPVADPDAKRGVIRLDGDVPSPRHKPSGCPFHTRCPRYIGDICVTQAPPLREDANGHQIRCHYTLAELSALQVSAEGSAS